MTKRFIKENKSWLDSSIAFPRQCGVKRGRVEVEFEDCCERSKNKKTAVLRNENSSSLLAHATQMSLRVDGKTKASKMVKIITTSSPNKVEKLYKSFSSSSTVIRMSREEALAVLIEAQLSRHQYNVIRSSDSKRYPSYSQVQIAKRDCYPKNECISISETSAKISLQALLDHTVERILLFENQYNGKFNGDELNSLCLYTKWGFDGSSGHTPYKQAFHDSNADDSSVFMTSIVPIKLINNNMIIWQNPRPASPRYCRPLKLEYIKETAIVKRIELTRK